MRDEAYERRLVELERPQAHLLQVEGESLLERLYGNARLHELIPRRLALGLAALRGRFEWLLLSRRRHEARAAAGLVGGSPRRRVVTEAVLAELQWRFAEAQRLPIDGLEHLNRARAEGRGVLLVSAHVGSMLNLLHGLAGRGLKVYIAGGHPLDEPLPPGRSGRWVAEQNRMLELAGCRWVHKGGAFSLLRGLLRRGEVVWIAADAPGAVPAMFRGRSVSVGSGPAALALETGASIVPAFALRSGLGERGLLLEPIDPRDFDSVETLAQSVLDVVGDVVARDPDQAHTTLLWLLNAH